MIDSEILKLKDAAAFLKISPQVLTKLIVNGSDIPFFKIGKGYRFNKDSLIKWISESENKNR